MRGAAMRSITRSPGHAWCSRAVPPPAQHTFPLGIFPATSLPLAISAPTMTEYAMTLSRQDRLQPALVYGYHANLPAGVHHETESYIGILWTRTLDVNRRT